jgi:hypothetical protein
MDRRLLLTALACWPAARLHAQDGPRPRHKIAAAQLHDALSKRFPLRFALAGVLELEVSAPALLLRPSTNQLGASLVAQATGPALRRPQAGELDVVFSLRFEPADRTLRAHRPDLLGLRLPGLSAEGVQAFRRLWPALTREAMGEIVLHRFSDRDLALPDTMGFEPEKLTVRDDGLLVVFAPKARR